MLVKRLISPTSTSARKAAPRAIRTARPETRKRRRSAGPRRVGGVVKAEGCSAVIWEDFRFCEESESTHGSMRCVGLLPDDPYRHRRDAKSDTLRDPPDPVGVDEGVAVRGVADVPVKEGGARPFRGL